METILDFLLVLLVLALGSFKMLKVNQVIDLFELVWCLHLDDGFVRADVKDLLHRKNIPTILINVPINVFFPSWRFNLHIWFKLNHVVTESLNVHEIISQVKICYIVLWKVVPWIDVHLTFCVVTNNIHTNRQQVFTVF